jgi:hypothetical protein
MRIARLQICVRTEDCTGGERRAFSQFSSQATIDRSPTSGKESVYGMNSTGRPDGMTSVLADGVRRDVLFGGGGACPRSLGLIWQCEISHALSFSLGDLQKAYDRTTFDEDLRRVMRERADYVDSCVRGKR